MSNLQVAPYERPALSKAYLFPESESLSPHPESSWSDRYRSSKSNRSLYAQSSSLMLLTAIQIGNAWAITWRNSHIDRSACALFVFYGCMLCHLKFPPLRYFLSLQSQQGYQVSTLQLVSHNKYHLFLNINSENSAPRQTHSTFVSYGEYDISTLKHLNWALHLIYWGFTLIGYQLRCDADKPCIVS